MKNKDIERVITQKRAYKSSSFLFRWGEKYKNDDVQKMVKTEKVAKNIAILTPKKYFTTAVDRNKARRRIKAVFVANLKDFLGKNWSKGLKSIEIVITVNQTIKTLKYKDILEESKQVLLKSGIIQSVTQLN